MDEKQKEDYERKVNYFTNSHRDKNLTFDHELILASDFNEEIENQIGFPVSSAEDVLFILRCVERVTKITIDDIKKEYNDKDLFYHYGAQIVLVLTVKNHS